MNAEKLRRLQTQVRIGGKGTPRRKKKVMHQSAATDDKKLQSSLKKLSVSTIPGIEEVNIIKDDLTVIHFNNPKAQASLSANTFAVTGHGETKKIVEMLPEILPQLGQDTVMQLRMFANTMSGNQAKPNTAPGSTLENVAEDDEVPLLVNDFEEVAKMEEAKSKDAYQKVELEPQQGEVKNKEKETIKQNADESKKSAEKNDKKAKKQQNKQSANGAAKNKTELPKNDGKQPQKQQKKNEKPNKQDVNAAKMSTNGANKKTEILQKDQQKDEIKVADTLDAPELAVKESKTAVKQVNPQASTKENVVANKTSELMSTEVHKSLEKASEIKETKPEQLSSSESTKNIDHSKEQQDLPKEAFPHIKDLKSHPKDIKLQQDKNGTSPQPTDIKPQQAPKETSSHSKDIKPQQAPSEGASPQPKETNDAKVDGCSKITSPLPMQGNYVNAPETPKAASSQQPKDQIEKGATPKPKDLQPQQPPKGASPQPKDVKAQQTPKGASPQPKDLKPQQTPKGASPQPKDLKPQEQPKDASPQPHDLKPQQQPKDSKTQQAPKVGSPQPKGSKTQQAPKVGSPQPKDFKPQQSAKGTSPQLKDLKPQPIPKGASPQPADSKPQQAPIESPPQPQGLKLQQTPKSASPQPMNLKQQESKKEPSPQPQDSKGQQEPSKDLNIQQIATETSPQPKELKKQDTPTEAPPQPKDAKAEHSQKGASSKEQQGPKVNSKKPIDLKIELPLTDDLVQLIDMNTPQTSKCASPPLKDLKNQTITKDNTPQLQHNDKAEPAAKSKDEAEPQTDLKKGPPLPKDLKTEDKSECKSIVKEVQNILDSNPIESIQSKDTLTANNLNKVIGLTPKDKVDEQVPVAMKMRLDLAKTEDNKTETPKQETLEIKDKNELGTKTEQPIAASLIEQAVAQVDEVLAAAAKDVAKLPTTEVVPKSMPTEDNKIEHPLINEGATTKLSVQQNKQSPDKVVSAPMAKKDEVPPKPTNTSASKPSNQAPQTKPSKQTSQKTNQQSKPQTSTKPTDKPSNAPKQTNTQSKSAVSHPKKANITPPPTTTPPTTPTEVSKPTTPTESTAPKVKEVKSDNQKKQATAAQKPTPAKPNTAKPSNSGNKATPNPVTPTGNKKMSPPTQDNNNKQGKHSTPPKSSDNNGPKAKQATSPKAETKQTKAGDDGKPLQQSSQTPPPIQSAQKTSP